MTSQSVDHISRWNAFIHELQERMLPIYLQHEMTFDPWGVHGRMHICRSVMFAEWMARFYTERASCEIDFYAVWVATAMHDSGRRDNGVDLWEKDSSVLCYNYVRDNYPRQSDMEYAQFVANLIDKSKTGGACKWIVNDADVLEIMRPCCGHGGIAGFRRECLHFAGDQDLLATELLDSTKNREEFIQEAWKWITYTESMKLRLFPSMTYMTDLLEKLRNERTRYPLLSSLV